MAIVQDILKELGGAIAAVLLVLGGLWVFAKDVFLAHIESRLDRQNRVFSYNLERAAVTADEHSKALFNSSLEVWTALCDVKRDAEKLWRVASWNNVDAANDSLERLVSVTDRHSALIMDREQGRLLQSVNRMIDYLQGKGRLIELRKRNASQDEVQAQIYNNGEILRELLNAVSTAKNGLKTRILPQIPSE